MGNTGVFRIRCWIESSGQRDGWQYRNRCHSVDDEIGIGIVGGA